MAGNGMSSQKSKRFIFDLPYSERRQLEKLLDADDKWEELGGRFMDMDYTDLALIRRSSYHRESPTNTLLEKFSQKNGTINELFVMLSQMEYYRAMRIIVNYVNPKYHHLLNDNITSPTGLIQASYKTSPYPSAPNQTKEDSKSLVEGATAAPFDNGHHHPNDKFEVDPSNFNHALSYQDTLASKLPGIVGATGGKSSSHKMAGLVMQESETYNVSEETGLVRPYPSKDKEAEKLSIGVKKLNIAPPSLQDGKKMSKASEGACATATSITGELPLVMRIPHKDILRATDSFNDSRILGRGGFGIVYLGEWKGISVAIKRLVPKNRPDAGDTVAQQISLNQSMTELKVLNSCRIDNILPLYGVSLEGPEPCIVYQYMSNGSLEDRLLCKANTQPLNWVQRANIADGVAKGLNFLHTLPDKPLVHGDIKSANILLDSDMKAKIGDFGLAREGPGSESVKTHIKLTSLHGTQVYLPPEYLRQNHLSTKVDVFSYGIVMLEIATGQRAINDRRPKSKLLLEHVTDIVGSGQSETLRDLKAGVEGIEWFDELLKIGQICSQKLKSKRPDMIEVLKRFEQARETINMNEKIRKISREMGELPPQMSPMEIQLWYDIRNGPNFMPPPDHHYPRPDNEHYMRQQNFNAGIKRRNFQLAPLNVSPPPTYSSFHASQIREPPSMVEHGHSPSLYDGSCVATAGSSNYGPTSIPVATSETQPADQFNSNSLPILTILGNKSPNANGGVTSDLGPTPHPSGILSGLPLKNTDSNVVVTPKLTISSDFYLDSSDSDS